MKRVVIAVLFFAVCLPVFSQKISIQEYINTYKDVAISEMKRSGIPASITIAQGILETESGNSDLVRRSNNHFGIKCKSNWTGSSVFHDDDAAGECFRKYDNAEDSYKDHSNFLRGSSRYAFLFDLEPSDYKGWAYGLKKAGYATNPKYPEILIRNIEENNLHQFDQGANGLPLFDATKFDEKDAAAKIIMEPIHYTEMNTAQNVASIKAGKTLFNGLKAVFVGKHTSLLAIATEYNISLSKLLEYNDLKTDGLLKEEQWIFLEKKLKQGNRDIYITQQGETLYEIAQTNAIQLEYLLQYNNVSENESLRKGTKIRLRPMANTKDKAATRIHEVQEKEGLYSIARKYNVPVDSIRENNNLSSDELKVGQQLVISK